MHRRSNALARGLAGFGVGEGDSVAIMCRNHRGFVDASLAVPDFLPVAGQLDDAVLLVLALRVLLGGATTEMLRQAWPGPEASLRLILRASGHETNGAASPGQASTL